MKRPWLAATLNLIPGLGYLYLDITRILGWLLLFGVAGFLISLFDPSNNTGTSPQGIWNLWDALFLLCPLAAFIIDGYLEAKKTNARLIKTGVVKPPKPIDMPHGAVISPIKFFFLSVITFNLYGVYWSWRLWETIREEKGNKDKLTSSILAVFNGLSNFSLFPKLRDMAKQKGYASKYPVYLSAAVIFAAGIAGRAIHSWVVFPLVVIIIALVQLPIVQMQNHYMHETKGKFAPTRTNWGLIIFLVALDAVLALLSANYSG